MDIRLAGLILSSFEVTDKGTPGVILGRKAKAFGILDFQFWIEGA
jgi:hypothetical protein